MICKKIVAHKYIKGKMGEISAICVDKEYREMRNCPCFLLKMIWKLSWGFNTGKNLEIDAENDICFHTLSQWNLKKYFYCSVCLFLENFYHCNPTREFSLPKTSADSS